MIPVLLVLLAGWVHTSLVTPISVEYVYMGLNGPADHNTAVSVSFFTFTVPANDTYQPIILYGTESGSLNFKSEIGFSRFYNKDKGYTHVAMIQGLKPNTKYYYRCGDLKYGLSKLEYDFVTTDGNPSEMLILGDMGILRSGNVIKRLAEYVDNNTKSGKSSMIFHIGDMGYADDYPEFFERVFNHWFNLITGIAARAPYMVLPGNFFDPIC
jgi:hypothetical protein